MVPRDHLLQERVGESSSEDSHKALFVPIALRRWNFEMVATGEGKSLQQTDSKSKRPEREGAG